MKKEIAPAACFPVLPDLIPVQDSIRSKHFPLPNGCDGDKWGANGSLGLQFRCMWVFAKALFQGELEPQNWVLVCCLNSGHNTQLQYRRKVPAPSSAPTDSSIWNRPSPHEAFATVAVTGIRDLVSSDLIALSDKRHQYSRIRWFVSSSGAEHYKAVCNFLASWTNMDSNAKLKHTQNNIHFTFSQWEIIKIVHKDSWQ